MFVKKEFAVSLNILLFKKSSNEMHGRRVLFVYAFFAYFRYGSVTWRYFDLEAERI
jgi:hypothetical protein